MSSGKLSRKTDVPAVFSYDQEIRQQYPLIAGIDEAGRGPLAGPVVAASVILPPGLIIEGLRDSKKIPSEDNRKKLFWKIVSNAVSIGVGIIDSEVIDRINILESTRLAMRSSIDDLKIKPDILLIDAVKLSGMAFEQRSIIRGESVSASIAAASIIAKVVRDDIMLDYHEKYPAYNFRSHKGYSTMEHMKCISEIGPCPIHRKSFKKVIDVNLPFEG
ncbi:MAG: ribonuclease HII [Nitrospiraceae bacterium]|nr:MAG: ribonuclease HII [Nitrospiraceae bacterium]